VGEADIQGVTKVLRADWLTTGPMREAFEQIDQMHGGAVFVPKIPSMNIEGHP
jgi:dTDP-4-amino-4,6-dideoxygalactose transaminase